jgi:hypothetical protein
MVDEKSVIHPTMYAVSQGGSRVTDPPGGVKVDEKSVIHPTMYAVS